MRALYVSIVPVVLASQVAVGQRAPSQFESLRPDQLVRVRTVTHGLHIGRFESVQGDSLYMRPGRGSRSVELAAISDIWVRGTATVGGAKVGGIVGAILGGSLAAFASAAFCDAASCNVDPAVTLGGVLVGGMTGAVSGAVIGAMFGQWHKRYP